MRDEISNEAEIFLVGLFFVDSTLVVRERELRQNALNVLCAMLVDFSLHMKTTKQFDGGRFSSKKDLVAKKPYYN